MLRTALVVAVVPFAMALALSSTSCKDAGTGASGEGGAGTKGPKLICKMNNQCLVCPDDDAMKKCIINPATSGCKQATSGECN